MGQPLPLPERIPRPDDETSIILQKHGIQVHEELNEKYLLYTLPEGWKIVDRSHRHDLPCFYFVDANNNVHFAIQGAWKGTYDNQLEIYAIKSPYKLE